MKLIIFLYSVLLFTSASFATGNSVSCSTSLFKESYFSDNLKYFNENGFVTANVPMNNNSLHESYDKGLFPWVDNENGTFSWFSPEERGILKFENLRISRSMRKDLKQAKDQYDITFDKSFSAVINEASRVVRKKEDGEIAGTWISEAFISNYSEFHKAGYAHSVEVWDKSTGELVGGLYGVYVSGVFSGSSMFNKKNNSSKYALFSLIERLKAKGHTWIDTQLVSTVLGRFGAKLVPRDEFLQLKSSARKSNLEY